MSFQDRVLTQQDYVEIVATITATIVVRMGDLGGDVSTPREAAEYIEKHYMVGAAGAVDGILANRKDGRATFTVEARRAASNRKML